MEGLVLQLQLELLAQRDVVDQGAEPDRVAAADRPDGQLSQELVPVAMQRGHLDALADQPALSGGQVAGHAGAMGGALRDRDDELLQRLAERIVTGPAEGLLRLRVPVDDVAGGIDGDVRLAGALDDQPRLLLALPQRELSLLLQRDIDHETAVAGRLVAFVADHHPLVANPHLPSVAGPHAVLAHGLRADLPASVELLVLDHRLSIVGVDVRHPQARVGHPLLRAVAEQVLNARADVMPGRLGPEVGDVQDRWQLLDHGAISHFGRGEVAHEPAARSDTRPDEEHQHAHRAHGHEHRRGTLLVRFLCCPQRCDPRQDNEQRADHERDDLSVSQSRHGQRSRCGFRRMDRAPHYRWTLGCGARDPNSPLVRGTSTPGTRELAAVARGERIGLDSGSPSRPTWSAP